MRNLAISLLALVTAAVGAAPITPKINIKVLTALDGFEPFDAHLFHAGHLWVGKSRNNLSADYTLQAYDSSGTLIASVKPPHSIRYLYSYSPDAVILSGVAAEPNQTFYSIARVQNGAIKIQSKMIPITAWADRAVGNSAGVYFTDPGGLDDGSPLDVALRTLFTMQGSTPRYLKARIRGPGHAVLHGKSLFVIEQPAIGLGGRNLVRVNLADESSQWLFEKQRAYLNNLIELTGVKRLALSERDAGQLLLVDPSTGKLTAEIAVGSEGRGMAEFGKCVAIGHESSKKVSFVRVDGEPKVVAEWDLSAVGEDLFRLRNVAVDPASGRVYGRSAYPCSPVEPCPEKRNSVVIAEESEGKTTLEACR